MFYIIPILYYSLASLFSSFNMFPETSYSGCGNEYMSYTLVSLGCVSYITYTSFTALINNESSKIENDTVYGRNEYIEEYVILPMVYYQFWNLTISLLKKEFMVFEMIAHHFIAFMISLLCVYPQPYLQYYIPYFFAVEISSIFLTFIDIFKSYPNLADKYYYTNLILSLCFVITFFIFRIILWTHYNVRMVIDVLTVEKYKTILVVLFTLPANIIITFLQYYWQFKICKKILRLSYK